MTEAFDLKIFAARCQQRVDEKINHWLDQYPNHSARLVEAMRYTTLNGGKRFRPMLVYATTDALKGDMSLADHAAVAVELIHAYSLVHDDLPAMDNDDLRRGQPTCHLAFDEATAILTGDALQSLAFGILTKPNKLSAQTQLKMIDELTQAANTMVIGQALDIAAASLSPPPGRGEELKKCLEQLENIHCYKTGALIQASVNLAALAANADIEQQQALQQYAHHLGLAFQIQDDVLDVVGHTQQLGKQSGADAQLNKLTYPGLMGLEQAQQKAQQHYQQALTALSLFGNSADALRALAKYVIERHY